MPFEEEDRQPRLSPTSGAEPYASPYYNRAFWASYKGLSRGMFGGIILGAALGLGIGGVLAGGVLAYGALVPSTFLTAGAMYGAALAVAAASTAVGAKYGKDAFAVVGAVAGSNSTVMEINDQKTKLSDMKLDKLLDIEDRKGSMKPGELDTLRKDIALLESQQDQYFEKKFSPRPFVFGKVAVVGALAGLLFGIAVVGGGAVLAGKSILDISGLFSSLVSSMPATLAVGATLAGSALAGASYGINRDIFRRVFDVTNPLYDGDLSPLDRLRTVRARGVDPAVALTPKLQPVSERAASAVPRYAVEADSGFVSGAETKPGFAERLKSASPRPTGFMDRVEAAADVQGAAIAR